MVVAIGIAHGSAGHQAYRPGDNCTCYRPYRSAAHCGTAGRA